MDVFEAIGDAHRRRVIELVAEKPRSASEIAREFSISRPAVSQHLAALTDCGILTVRPDGRQRIYSLDKDSLAEPRDWLDEQRHRWNSALARLETEMDRAAGDVDD